MLRSLPRCRRAAATKGFTLIELMAVVAILGILAVVAVAAYTKQIRNARKSTVIANVSAIALRQRNHLAVVGHYASSTGAEGPGDMYPTDTDIAGAGGEFQWDIASNGYTSNDKSDADAFFRGGPDLHGFDALRFMPEAGRSRCGYATVSGYGTNAMVPAEADEPPSATLADLVFPSGSAGEPYYARDWFYTYALCDFDEDGIFWAFTNTHYTSDVNSGGDPSGTYRENE